MGGPTVMGTDIRPSRKPMAWDTSLAPTSSKAIGAMMQMKQPSNSPISRHTAINPPKMLHSGIIIDMKPMTKKDITWEDKTQELTVSSLCCHSKLFSSFFLIRDVLLRFQ